MSNVLMIPASGAIIFDSQSANSSIVSPLSAAPRLSYDNAGGLNITSYTTAASALDRFSVDGASGRLFSVSDSLTGSIFSVNDAAGLPIIEVESNLVDKITMGTYGSNALVINDTKVGMGTALPTAKLDIVDTTLAGSGGLSGSVLKLTQTWNTSSSPTAITLNVTNSASGAASNLMDLQVNNISRFKFTKNGAIDFGPSNTANQRSVINSGTGQLTIFARGDVPTQAYAAAGLYNGVTAGLFIGSGFGLQWSSGSFADGGTYDLTLVRDSAHVLAQNGGVNPQESRIYGTYTSTTIFERLYLKYNATDFAFQIGTAKGSAGGAARPLQLQTDGTTRMTITSAGNVGIGVITPLNTLHVYSANSEFARFERNAPTAAGSMALYQSGTNTLILGYNSNVGNGIANGGIASAGVIRGDLGLHLVSGSSALGGITVTTSGNVGIGTTAPNQRLTVTGNISATGIVYGDGSGLTNVGGSSPYTTGGGSFSITTVLGSNTASGYFASINGGSVNTASGYYSVINGGIFNTASGYNSTINSGRANTACGTQSIVNSGDTNTASGYRSAVINGRCNTASGACSTVSNGFSSRASAPHSTISNGNTNTASGIYSTVLNGNLNIASGYRTTVINGRCNTASGATSTTVSGIYNTASGYMSLVGNGGYNTASGYYSTTVSGLYNTASGIHSTIINGTNNIACLDNTYILGSGITTDKPNTTYVESLQVMTTGYLYMRDTATLAYRCVAITNGAFVIV